MKKDTQKIAGYIDPHHMQKQIHTGIHQKKAAVNQKLFCPALPAFAKKSIQKPVNHIYPEQVYQHTNNCLHLTFPATKFLLPVFCVPC